MSAFVTALWFVAGLCESSVLLSLPALTAGKGSECVASATHDHVASERGSSYNIFSITSRCSVDNFLCDSP